jgi:pyroglutamyl-peptidase
VAGGPKLLVTGFGPFPGAPENPTQALVLGLAGEPAETFGASALRAVVLPTDYRRSWRILRRFYRDLAPDVVVHFGLSRNAEALAIERAGKRRIDPARPDAAAFAPLSGFCRRSGADSLDSTLPVEAIVAALSEAGFPAAVSDDAGSYVCNPWRTAGRLCPRSAGRHERLHVRTAQVGSDAGPERGHPSLDGGRSVAPPQRAAR